MQAESATKTKKSSQPLHVRRKRQIYFPLMGNLGSNILPEDGYLDRYCGQADYKTVDSWPSALRMSFPVMRTASL